MNDLERGRIWVDLTILFVFFKNRLPVSYWLY